MPIQVTVAPPGVPWWRKKPWKWLQFDQDKGIEQASDPTNLAVAYVVGVGAEWVWQGQRRTGFITVAHPFWKRGQFDSSDQLSFPESGNRSFLMRSVCVLPRSWNVDASLHTLELLPPGSQRRATEGDLNTVLATYCPPRFVTLIPAGLAGTMGGREVSFEYQAAGGPWSKVTNHCDPIPDTDPVDGTPMGELAGLRQSMRAVWMAAGVPTRFEVGYSGQPWCVNGQLLAIQSGVLPSGLAGYGLLADVAVTTLEWYLSQMVGYSPNTLRVVSLF